ncbi:hypothetical protein [Paenibacillus polymyxa]|uniref:Uncharacterized protein n=1 Tax=Paenibacillus polymyxa TaxID=1406 RepID=A0ABX2ZG20_PAEPO|nr:hypothetical protein [Paenibacillus polymyxa]ODA10528.1 hypothetical protein A7312_23535 [Paenibacillus polymyxa]
MDKNIQEIREWHEREERRIKKYPESKKVRYPNEPSEKAYNIIVYLLQQIEIKDKALEFYEDEMNYTEAITVPGEEESFLLILEDKGRVARAALKGEDTSE